jgi:hypothetical protein
MVDTHLSPDIHTEDGNSFFVQNVALKASGTWVLGLEGQIIRNHHGC